MTSWESTCLPDTKPTACPGNSCPSIVVWRFWFMDNMNLSTKPSPCGRQWPKWEAEWRARSVKWSAMSAFLLVFMGQSSGCCSSVGGCNKRGGRILSHLGVYPVIRPIHDGGSDQRWQQQSPSSPLYTNTHTHTYSVYMHSHVSLWYFPEDWAVVGMQRGSDLFVEAALSPKNKR